MEKVTLWLPVKTHNTLFIKAMAKGKPIEQLAANVLYSALNNLTIAAGWSIDGEFIANPKRDDEYEQLLGKFILSTLKSGISIDDLYMNGLDGGLKADDILNTINGLVNDGVIEIDTNAIVRYRYYGKVKRSLYEFKGKKIQTKDAKPKPKLLVTKLKPRS